MSVVQPGDAIYLRSYDFPEEVVQGAQSVKPWLYKHDDLSLSPRTHI